MGCDSEIYTPKGEGMPPLYGEGTVRLWENPACVHGAAIKTGPRFYVVGMFRRKLDNLNII